MIYYNCDGGCIVVQKSGGVSPRIIGEMREKRKKIGVGGRDERRAAVIMARHLL